MPTKSARIRGIGDRNPILARISSPTASSLQIRPSSSLRVRQTCLSAPPRVLAPPSIAFTYCGTAHSPRFLCRQLFSPSHHRTCHLFDSDASPHDSHTRHEALVFVLILGRRKLNLDTISFPFTALDFVWFRYTRFPIVLFLWLHYFTHFSTTSFLLSLRTSCLQPIVLYSSRLVFLRPL